MLEIIRSHERTLNENPCVDCGFYDSDMGGCTCPSVDKWYACPLEPEPSLEDFMTEEELRTMEDRCGTCPDCGGIICTVG